MLFCPCLSPTTATECLQALMLLFLLRPYVELYLWFIISIVLAEKLALNLKINALHRPTYTVSDTK